MYTHKHNLLNSSLFQDNKQVELFLLVMCDSNSMPSSTSPFLCPTKTQLITPHPKPDDQVEDELHRWPTPNEVMKQNLIINTRKNKYHICSFLSFPFLLYEVTSRLLSLYRVTCKTSTTKSPFEYEFIRAYRSLSTENALNISSNKCYLVCVQTNTKMFV